MAGASLWTRATDRLNAIVWRMPLPRRVVVRVSALVYRNPPMSAERVHEALDALARAGIEAWCMGGWGVDALLGEQSRTHRDLDLIVDRRHAAATLATLRGLGYAEWYRNAPAAWSWYRMPAAPRQELQQGEDLVVMRDDALRAVDIHCLALAHSGLTSAPGIIGGRPVRCLSAESQAQAYETYFAQIGRHHRNMAAVRRVM